MRKAGYDAYRYSVAVVIVFGILGNILVVISILRQKHVLKKNYYFLVLQLAICDLGTLTFWFLDDINFLWLENPLSHYSNKFYCLPISICYAFQVAGIGMMLMISVLRYRATVHPLEPAITRGKLKVVSGLVYVFGLIVGYGPAVPGCLMHSNEVLIVYNKIHLGYFLSCIMFFPTIFMAVVYFKIGRALIKQNKYIKSVCSNPVEQSVPSSSFNILKSIRNRKTFFICLVTVLCYGVGNIPVTVYYIWKIVEEYHLKTKYIWIFYLADVLRVAGSYSVNPLIYGILDKKLFTFWKLFCK